LKILDPQGRSSANNNSHAVTFCAPKSRGGALLGNFHYFQTGEPRLPTKGTIGGRSLVTTNSGRNYVCVALDSFGYIEQITYLGSSPLPEAPNWICLIGLHEKYLNCLVSRFDEGLIADLVSYLQSWWSVALYHNSFANFKSSLQKYFVDPNVIDKLQHSKGSTVRDTSLVLLTVQYRTTVTYSTYWISQRKRKLS
jgi:hypothetical protein